VPIAEPQQLDQVFHALADSNRRAIVARLTRGAASVSELSAPLEHVEVLQHGR
jgi:DNA-binding transcriptional ArsR family regulator